MTVLGSVPFLQGPEGPLGKQGFDGQMVQFYYSNYKITVLFVLYLLNVDTVQKNK